MNTHAKAVPLVLNPILDDGKWSASHNGLFTHGERALGTHFMRGWVSTKVILDAWEERTISSSSPKRTTSSPYINRRHALKVVGEVSFKTGKSDRRR
jgi:hypothetical protein